VTRLGHLPLVLVDVNNLAAQQQQQEIHFYTLRSHNVSGALKMQDMKMKLTDNVQWRMVSPYFSPKSGDLLVIVL